jgi:hypothetical protein
LRKKEAHVQSAIRLKRLKAPVQGDESEILQRIGVNIRSFYAVVERLHSLNLAERYACG